MLGRTVRLFLADGTPTGVITAEIMNWTGHVLVLPRSRLGEALQREEMVRTGVYFLIGDDPAQPSKPRVYVGEADIIGERIKSHAKDQNKEFWTRACIVTSKDANLTKAHGRYLEQRFVELTKNADRANIANGNEPGRKSLPESDIADMEYFITQVELILPVIGFDFLRAPVRALSSLASDATPHSGAIELALIRRGGFEARAVELDGEVTVLAGSTATTKADYAHNTYASLREQLIQEGRLVQSANPDLLEFKDNVTFSSPSAAAAVVTNRNANGRIEWKLVNTGQTLKEWQDSQLAE